MKEILHYLKSKYKTKKGLTYYTLNILNNHAKYSFMCVLVKVLFYQIYRLFANKKAYLSTLRFCFVHFLRLRNCTLLISTAINVKDICKHAALPTIKKSTYAYCLFSKALKLQKQIAFKISIFISYTVKLN